MQGFYNSDDPFRNRLVILIQYPTNKLFNFMAQHIPISFIYNGSRYEGYFNQMKGGTVWHLMINNYYRGQLIYSPAYGFRFCSNKGDFEELSDFFGECIRRWKQFF